MSGRQNLIGLISHHAKLVFLGQQENPTHNADNRAMSNTGHHIHVTSTYTSFLRTFGAEKTNTVKETHKKET